MLVLRRSLALLIAGALPAAALAIPSGAPAAAEVVDTNFALQATGWSTQVRGGDVAARSGPTGLAYVMCTRQAGKEDVNHTLAANLPAGGPVLQVGATTTRAWTSKAGATVSSNAVNNVASVTIGDTQTSGLVLESVVTRTRSAHDAEGYAHSGDVSVAKVTRYTQGVAADIPFTGGPVVVPGLVRVTFGQVTGAATDQFATAKVTGVRIDLEASNSTVLMGRSETRIDGGAVAGIMHGPVWGSTVEGVNGVANSGRTALRPLPCQGTAGEWRSNQVADVHIPGIAHLSEVVSRVRGDQTGDSAYAEGTSRISRVDLLGRRIVIKGIRADGLVRLRSNGTRDRSAQGTSVTSITVDGEQHAIPRRGGTLRIPGVARITVGLVEHTPDGIRIRAAHVVLLDGGQVHSRLSLGNVNLGIRRH